MIQKLKKQMDETRSWFFGKINKTDKPLARITKKKRERQKKGERTQINKITNEREEITTNTTDLQRIIREYSKT